MENSGINRHIPEQNNPKVKDVLRSKRESSQYCACPSYGYRKDREDKNRLARTR